MLFKHRLDAISYTQEHRKAFRLLEKEIFGNFSFKWLFHDFDKVILYALIGVKYTSKIHRFISTHHVKSFWPRFLKDTKSMYLDYECARFSKKDKQLNADETITEWFESYRDAVMKHHCDYDDTLLRELVELKEKPKL